ncbi:MAG: hypothetical protein KIS94_07880 [Chitinophagales bacterium]|nr:hypothetical protein [Chitinophagales bacterium]
MEPIKTKRAFWTAFTALIGLAAIATIGNLLEYNRMEKLSTKGKRILLPVDSVVQHGNKRELFVTLSVNGEKIVITKKVKSEITTGDSVPVYYLQENPATNSIALE